MPFDPDTALGGRRDRFPTTRHSLLDAAEHSPPALAALIELYWKPVYKHLRLKWQLGNEEAKELTQSAFAELLAQQWLAGFDAARGTFRTYLRTCVDRLVLDEREAGRRQKRGGGQTMLPLDFAGAERELQLVDRSPAPDEIFEREWRREVLSLAIAELRARCAGDIRFAIFAAYDLAEPGARPSYDELARRHALPVTQVTNHLAWARRELRRLAIERIQNTSANRHEARSDARSIFGA
jgi:RNA polymerase sigma factor (sigma-70 family)